MTDKATSSSRATKRKSQGGTATVDQNGLDGTYVRSDSDSVQASIQDLVDSLDVDRNAAELPQFPEKSFALREIRDGVVEFMITQVRIPVSQRKRMIATLEKSLNRKIDTKRDNDFYNAFFDFVEVKPSRITFLAITSDFPDASIQDMTYDKFKCSLNNFAPIKLSTKVLFDKEMIADRVEADGISSISTPDIVGMFFYYGSVHGNVYVKMASDYATKQNVLHGVGRELSALQGRIGSALERGQYSKIIPLCEKAIPLDKRQKSSSKEVENARVRLERIQHDLLEKTVIRKKKKSEEPKKKAVSVINEDSATVMPSVSSGDGEELKPNISSAKSKVLCKLIEDGNIGIAARLADAYARSGKNPLIPEKSLHLAAASRISFETWNDSIQQFVDKVEPTVQEVTGDSNGGAMVAGSLLCIAILHPGFFQRTTLNRLSLGDFASSIGDLVREISKLDYMFSPDLDQLATTSGASSKTRRKQIEENICEWKKILEQGQHAGIFRKITGADGEFGKVIQLILEKPDSAIESAHEVIGRFESRDHVLARINENRINAGRKSTERFPVSYICRRLAEGVDLLRQWLDAYEVEKSKRSDKSNMHLKELIGKLDSQASKAIKSLKAGESSNNYFQAAISKWLIRQIRDFRLLLKGKRAVVHSDIMSATYGELDLLPLPSDFPESEEEIHDCDKVLTKFMQKNQVPTREEAIKFHAKYGAFRKAARLLGGVEDSSLKDGLTKFVEDHRKKQVSQTYERIVSCLRGLNEAARFDNVRSDEIKSSIDDLERTKEKFSSERDFDLNVLGGLTGEDLPGDIIQVNRHLNSMEKLVKESQSYIREYKKKRLEDLQRENPERSTEIGKLIGSISTMPLDYVDDQIAHIRDGRAIGSTSAIDMGPFNDFFPSFVIGADAESWPSGYKQFSEALNDGGPIEVPADRQEAAQQVFKNWFALEKAVASSESSTTASLGGLFSDFSFQRVTPRRPSSVQGQRAWIHEVDMKVPDDPTRRWFVPPIFGSKSRDRYVVAVMHPGVLMEQVLPFLKSKSDGPVIIVVTGKIGVERRTDMARHLREEGIAALIIDETIVAFIASRKEDRLRVLFDCCLPFGRIEPYITDAGKLPPEMFFGRQQEIEKIVGRNAEGILVYGGRQLGKSALLAQVEGLHHRPKSQRFVVRRDIKNIGKPTPGAEEIWHIMANKLREFDIVSKNSNNRNMVISDIETWISRNPNGRILCLFDEADNFLASEARNDFPNLMHLKNLMENTDRAFKTVFAGLHHVQRMFKASNSPLAHFGNGICVGPLNTTSEDLEAAYRLVVVPMRAAGFRFESSNSPNEILSYVNHYPSLMQVYGKELISHLHAHGVPEDGPLWTIPNSILFEGEGFKNIKAEIGRKFGYTLDLDPRYKLIAYVLGFMKRSAHEAAVMRDGLSPQEIQSETSKYWPKRFEQIPLSDIQILLEEMFGLGILGHGRNPGTYCLRTEQVDSMLGTDDDVINELTDLEKIEPPADYNPSTHRRVLSGVSDLSRLRDARNISPLTDSQLREVLHSAEGNQEIQFITGAQLLGLYNVGKAIEDFSKTFYMNSEYPKLDVCVVKSESDYAKAMRKGARSESQLKVVIACSQKIGSNGKVVEKLINFTERLSAIKEGSIKSILVLDAVDNEMRQLAIRRNAIMLRPWGEDMLRTYLNLVEISDISDTEDIRESILSRTGGIPNEIVQLVSMIKKGKVVESVEVAQVGNIARSDHRLSQAVSILVEAQSMIDEDRKNIEIAYEIASQEIRNKTGVELDTIGYDLLALGALDAFVPGRNFRTTYFGRLLASQGT